MKLDASRTNFTDIITSFVGPDRPTLVCSAKGDVLAETVVERSCLSLMTLNFSAAFAERVLSLSQPHPAVCLLQLLELYLPRNDNQEQAISLIDTCDVFVSIRRNITAICYPL